MTKIHTLKIGILLVIVLELILSCSQMENPRPNLIFVMADDLGWGDPGFNGNPSIKTPHLDQMAAAGLIFSRFYSASPVCSPTRASCLTGRNPYRMGIPTANAGHLPTVETTLAEILKIEGYATGHFGKWHLGTLTDQIKDANRGWPGDSSHLTVPTDHGFEVFFSTESKVPTWNPMEMPVEFDSKQGESLRYGWIADSSKKTRFYGTHYWTGKNRLAKEELEGNDTELIMDQAIRFIHGAVQEKKSFLAVIWTHAPHLPVVVDQAYADLYPGETRINQIYYGSITAMDDQIGRLWKELDRMDLQERTCLFFCSDNGPEKQTPGSAGPFRGKKRDLYEGGVRVPAFVVWPGTIPSGKTDFPAVSSDYLPTAMDLITSQYPLEYALDGISLIDVLYSQKGNRKKGIGFLYPGKVSWLSQEYKIVSNNSGADFELYNLLNDPMETQNLANQKPGILLPLIDSLKSWYASFPKERQGDFPLLLNLQEQK